MIDAEPREVPFFPGGPEALLHVGEVGGSARGASGTMESGPWNLGPDGAPASGALGVLIDVVWGGAAVACAPPGEWGMSTEMEASFGRALPADGSLLRAHGEAVHRDALGALATGSVRALDGSVIAVGTQRTRFTPAAPRPRPLDPATWTALPGRGIADLLGLAATGDDADGGGPPAFAAGPSVANPAGIVHGGILFCAAELAASQALGAAAAGLVPSSLQIVYLRPGIIGEEIRCDAEVVYRGRTAAAVHVRCVRPDGKACSVATLSYGAVAPSKR